MKGRPPSQVRPFEFWWVIGFCLFAAARVLLFSAAFPFFNNVDERRHFDLVIRYAEGHVPRGAELISPATLPYLSNYASPEFLSAPEEFDGGTLYWVRFLNPFLVAALVWLAYVAARSMFPEQVALRLGVPLLIATVPQDAFYGINNDVLSPICFGLVFICLIKWFLEPKPSISLGIVTGLSIAAAYLTKLSNLPLIIVAVGAILWWCILEARAGRLRGAIPPLGALAVCAAIPIVAWLCWTKTHFGDFTGAASKAELLGWTTKPFSDWWSHPIFTAWGMWTFLSELIASFWRGEFMWHAKTVGSKGLDLFYVLSSLGLVVIAVISLARARGNNTSPARPRLLWIAAACVVA